MHLGESFLQGGGLITHWDSECNVQPGFQCKGNGIAGLQGIHIINCILCAKLLCDVMVTVSTLPLYMKVPKYFKLFANMINLNWYLLFISTCISLITSTSKDGRVYWLFVAPLP